MREVVSEASIRATTCRSAGHSRSNPASGNVPREMRGATPHLFTHSRRGRKRSGRLLWRLIAEWLGITHNAARVRVLRLRERLIEVAIHDSGPWRPGERQELYEFFRRSGLSERARRAVEGSRGAGGPERSRRGTGRTSRKERNEGEDQ